MDSYMKFSEKLKRDKIYLIDSGKVIASGKHDYLLKNNKIYKKLYNPEQIELNK